MAQKRTEVRGPKKIRVGQTWGMEGNLLFIPLASVGFAAVIFVSMAPQIGNLEALFVGSCVVVLAILFTFYFFVNRPPNFIVDWFCSKTGFNKLHWKKRK